MQILQTRGVYKDRLKENKEKAKATGVFDPVRRLGAKLRVEADAARVLRTPRPVII